jgi:GT2 family glycosyltransferase
MSNQISVIIPVHNGEQYLRSCLSNIAESDVAPLEIIVADDASTDASAAVAHEFGANVVRLPFQHGPARARNAAAQRARGDILLFLDADVCVNHQTIGLAAEYFDAHPDIDSIIGSYDYSPQDPNFVSCYKNLVHCHTHQISGTRASTFWTGCGAIRREVFFELGGFDESYTRACVEDIELGLRMVRAHKRIELVKQLQVKHLKSWSLLTLLKSDILDRAIPWAELILRWGELPNSLNLRMSQRVSALLIECCLVMAMFELTRFGSWFVMPLLTVLFLCLGRYWAQSVALRNGTGISVVLSVMLGAIAGMAYSRHAMLLPMIAAGEYLLLYLRDCCLHTSRMRRFSGFLIGVYFVAAAAYTLSYLPHHWLITTFMAMSAALLIINASVYLFLARRWGKLLAIAAIPLHWLYLLYCGPAFITGALVYKLKQIKRAGNLARPDGQVATQKEA